MISFVVSTRNITCMEALLARHWRGKYGDILSVKPLPGFLDYLGPDDIALLLHNVPDYTLPLVFLLSKWAKTHEVAIVDALGTLRRPQEWLEFKKRPLWNRFSEDPVSALYTFEVAPIFAKPHLGDFIFKEGGFDPHGRYVLAEQLVVYPDGDLRIDGNDDFVAAVEKLLESLGITFAKSREDPQKDRVKILALGTKLPLETVELLIFGFLVDLWLYLPCVPVVQMCSKCSGKARGKCSKCKNEFYCSKKCQKAHWKDHCKKCKG